MPHRARRCAVASAHIIWDKGRKVVVILLICCCSFAANGHDVIWPLVIQGFVLLMAFHKIAERLLLCSLIVA